MELRGYQSKSVDLIRESIRLGYKRPILCLPTGAGKTVTFSYLCKKAIEKGSMVNIVAHRTELLEQAQRTMKACDVDLSKVNLGMVQTYVRSPYKIPKAELTIIDECHIGNFRRFCEIVENRTQIIGVTATPIGASKKQPLNEVFDDVVSPVSIADLIADGYLAKPVYHLAKVNLSDLKIQNGEYSTESQNTSYSMLSNLDALMDAIRQCEGKTIVFCSSISMTKLVADMIPNSFCVHSRMSFEERERQVGLFKHSDFGIIVNCGILTAGFDDPAIRNVIVYRATTSLPLWLQMCGRGSRPDTGDFNIYDLGQNTRRHGAWHMDRDWKKIFLDQGKKVKDASAPYKNCVSCQSLIYASAAKCEICGTEQPRKRIQQAGHEGFEVIEWGKGIPDHLNKAYAAMSVKELIERARYGSVNTGRPFKPGWVLHQIKQRPNSESLLHEYAKAMGYKPGWVFRQMQ